MREQDQRGVGDETALELFVSVAARLEKERDDDGRSLRIRALKRVVDIHQRLGQVAQGAEIAEALVAEHFDDPPAEAALAMRDVGFALAKMRSDGDDHSGALAMYDRLIEVYGRPGMPEHDRTVAFANGSAAYVCGLLERSEEARARYRRVVEQLEKSGEPWARRELASALAGEAHALFEVGRSRAAQADCWDILARFHADEDPEIAEHVEWAREALAHVKSQKRGLLFRRR